MKIFSALSALTVALCLAACDAPPLGAPKLAAPKASTDQPAPAQSGKIVLLGHFDNMVSSDGEDPHLVSGYRLDLYRQGQAVFGNIAVATGSGEPVQAPLREVRYDEQKRTLAFEAKYSDGTEYNQDSGADGRESRVVLRFSGTLTANALQGQFQRIDAWHPKDEGEITRQNIAREKDDSVPDSLAAWQADYPAPKLAW